MVRKNPDYRGRPGTGHVTLCTCSAYAWATRAQCRTTRASRDTPLSIMPYRILNTEGYTSVTMTISQTIKPGQGLNDLKLNDSLYLVINQLKHEKINLIYSKHDYLNTPITIEMKQWGIHLVFINDKLKLISIKKFLPPPPRVTGDEGDWTDPLEETNRAFNYIYNNINLNNLTNGITLKLIYNKIFGPTYPGKIVDKSYLLNYPGIAFKFDISNIAIDGNLNLEALLNSPQEFVCQEIFLFTENSFDEFLKRLQNKDTNSVSTKSATGSTNEFKLKVNVKRGLIQLIVDSVVHDIEIGKTNQQEILNILGPPNDAFNKFDSRLLIHNKFFKHLKLGNHSVNSFLKFNNYFNLGIDFLYDLNNNGKLVKIILYNGNLIESNHFGHWNKCNYEIYLGINSTKTHPFSEEDYKTTCDDYFHEIPQQFFDQTTETTSTAPEPHPAGTPGFKGTTNPIILNRAESELINLDVIPINETNNWGQSKLYCYDHCIWEVLNNDCISCVTIYN